MIRRHAAVRINNYIVVIGGISMFNDISQDVIWTYNVYTELWRKHKIHGEIIPPPVKGPCATAIGPDIYMFGGIMLSPEHTDNELWKLSISQRCFKWSRIDFQHDIKLPSPRKGHTGWEYAGCFWVFRGVGKAAENNYLCDHGIFLYGLNNQLICFNPSTKKWTNPQCFGDVPSPRSTHHTAITDNKVWLYGGRNEFKVILDDFFCFNMQSFVWTQIESGQMKPQKYVYPSLNAVSDRYLILHGDTCLTMENSTWLMDLHSLKWIKHPCHDYARTHHTGTLGVNKCVIIIGGLTSTQIDDNTSIAFHVMLEPKSLKLLAMKTIYSKRRELPWRCLPQKLIAQLGLKVTKVNVTEGLH